jgi:hypothetical protein
MGRANEGVTTGDLASGGDEGCCRGVNGRDAPGAGEPFEGLAVDRLSAVEVGLRVGCGATMGLFLGLVIPVGVLKVRSRTLAFWGETGGLSSFSGEGVLSLLSLGSGVRPGRDQVGAGSGSRGAEDLAVMPGIAIPPIPPIPPRPKMG